MQSNMSETPSVKSRAQQIMDEVMAEEEEKMSMSQSQKGSVAGHEQNEAEEDDDEEEEEEDSDEEGHNVFYKAQELIVSDRDHLNFSHSALCVPHSTSRSLSSASGYGSMASPSTLTLMSNRWPFSMTASMISMRMVPKLSALMSLKTRSSHLDLLTLANRSKKW